MVDVPLNVLEDVNTLVSGVVSSAVELEALVLDSVVSLVVSTLLVLEPVIEDEILLLDDDVVSPVLSV